MSPRQKPTSALAEAGADRMEHLEARVSLLELGSGYVLIPPHLHFQRFIAKCLSFHRTANLEAYTAAAADAVTTHNIRDLD